MDPLRGGQNAWISIGDRKEAHCSYSKDNFLKKSAYVGSLVIARFLLVVKGYRG